MTLLEIISEYRDEAQRLLLFIVVASALRWGAGPERAAALTFVAMLLGDSTYHLIFGPGVNLLTLDIGHATIDFAAMVAFTTIAVAANRNYTLWIGALQIVAALAHVARNLDDAISPLVYAIMFFAPSYFQIGLLGAGLVCHCRRSQIHGTYRSWRTSSPPSWATGRLSWLDA